MRGLDIATGYYKEYGEKMLQEAFASVLPYLAAGLCGSGSECFGFDDEVSRDHDFEPGFILFLPGEDVVSRRDAFLLERAYAKLPKEYAGVSRGLMAPVGGPRRGVLRTADFLREKTGTPDGVLTPAEWLTIPQESLAEAVNGTIFFDNYGEISRIRERLAFYPPDIMKKKLAGSLLLMAQAGQYNYRRCLLHGEEAAAQLAAVEFARHAMEAVFLLNGAYMPYYKWAFRALRALPRLSLTAELLEYLITTDNGPSLADEKYDVMEGICSDIIEVLQEKGLTGAVCGDLEKHAYSVNDHITDPEIRNLHVLAGV